MVMRAVLGAVLVSGVAAGPAKADPQADLERLRVRIGEIETALRADRQKHDHAQTALAEIEQRLAPIAGRLREIQHTTHQLETELQRLREQADAAQAELREHQHQLARQLRSAYAAGRDAGLRALLNHGDPARSARLWGYHQQLSRTRASRIDAARAAHLRLVELQRQIAQRATDLALERQSAERTAAELEGRRRDRAAVLAGLRSQLARGGRHLEQLRHNEQRLLELIESLNRAIADVPDRELEARRFASRAGALSWPVRGTVLARFGTRRAPQLRWDGILVAAEAGTAVRAVAHGRVAFADWLRGYGLLVILDHGDGYMSLYGHNESLAKAVGDWVEPGDVIARVGDSGGQQRSALYFGVRHHGAPQNPSRWLQRG